MLNESREGPSLVPIERVAMPTNEATDKATRKMITQVKKTVSPRFPMTIGEQALSYKDVRFLELSDQQSPGRIRASLQCPNKEYVLQPHQSVDLLTGMCLFGATDLNGVLATGGDISLTDPLELKQAGRLQIQALQETSMIHPSEVSSILRISQALQLLQNSQTGEEKGKLSCHFHMPVVEYKLYMLDLIQKGMLPPQLFQEAVAKIEARAGHLAKILQKRLPAGIDVQPLSPLQAVGRLIEERQERTTFAECLFRLQQDPLLRKLIAAKKPQSFSELPNLSYIAGYLQQAQTSAQLGRGCLAVEIAEEQAILKNAVTSAEEVGVSCDMAGLYILSDVMSLTGRHGKEALFMHQPEEGVSRIQELKFVVQQSKGDICR